MELNIQAIADEKIKAMHESGQIKNCIEKNIEDTVIKAIDSALNGYSIRSGVEKQVSDCVSPIIKDIGFSGYNGFIASTIKKITEGVMREDIAKKIQSVFNNMLVAKHDGIKLSEIFSQYRAWVCESTDEQDKYDRENFVCDLEEKEEGNFKTYRVKFNDEKLERHDNPQIEFSLSSYRGGDATIAWLRLDGKSSDETFALGGMDKMQSLLANLYFNKTKIVVDSDDIDDDNSFDIDC